jgi:preprotein translocase SecE subunit
MSNGFTQYLKDTRGELRHVAWPTRLQTIVYSILVAALSVGIALYLGFFDFLFTSGFKQFLSALPVQMPIPAEQTATTTGATSSTVNVQTSDSNDTPESTTLPLNGQLPQ